MLAVTGEDPLYASPGVLGFMVVFVLAVATFLLIRSMVGHLRKIRYSAELAERTESERAEAVQAERAAAERAAAERGRPEPGA